MEELIELLNEYEKDWLNEFEKYTERWYCERTKQILCGKWENNNELTPYEIISKQYWFIKWLVENEKIDLEKVINGAYWCFPIIYIEYMQELYSDNESLYESLLMLLAIQDEPISFLISILK